MRHSSFAPLPLALAAAALLAAPAAHAFVRTQGCDASGNTCSELAWPTNCASFVIDSNSSVVTPLPIDLIQQELDASFEAWSRVGCSYLRITDEGVVSGEEVGFSGTGTETNLMTFVRNGWVDLPGAGHDPGVIALTSVFFDPSSGAIVSADTEFNAEFFEPVVVGDPTFGAGIDPNRPDADVRNTFTHEAGHYLGLAHTNVADATMFASADPSEIKKRTLENDDISGVCAIYPAADDPGVCEPAGFLPHKNIFGCAVGAGPGEAPAIPPALLLLVALPLLFALLLRRRRA